MSRRLALVGATVGLLGLVLVNVALSSAAAPNAAAMEPWGRNLFSGDAPIGLESHEGGQTLMLTTRETNFREVNVGGPGFSTGDYFVFREKVFNRAGAQIGIDNGQCTAHFPFNFQRRVAFLCDVAFTFFGRGQIMIEGRIAFAEDTTVATLPITGGTGHFQNVRGEVDVSGEQQTEIALHLLP